MGCDNTMGSSTVIMITNIFLDITGNEHNVNI